MSLKRFSFVSPWLLPAGAVGFILLFSTCKSVGVYTLCSYEDNWKANVCVSSTYSPDGDFWSIMTDEANSNHADADDSRSYRNQDVNILTVLPIEGDDWKGWDDFDLVFFYGHHNTIVPPHPHHYFDYYLYNGSSWNEYSGYLDEIGWGHTTNYDYYATRPVNNAHLNPAAVNYLYYKYTSSLTGGDYDYGGGSRPWRLRWNDPVQSLDYGELGDLNLEWLILHGCQAVITANEDGSAYNALGMKVFAPVHGKYHMILGHYASYYTSNLKPLDQFANDLLSGESVKEAYFKVDPATNTSVIAAESMPFSWSTSTMETDTWTEPVKDIEDALVFSLCWIDDLGAEYQTVDSWFPIPVGLLDIAAIPVDAPMVKEYLKLDTIRFRRANPTYLPKGRIPVLKLEAIDDGICRERLSALLRTHGANRKTGRIRQSGDIFNASSREAVFWVSRGSGGFSFHDFKRDVVAPVQMEDINKVVQLALEFVVQNRLVELKEGEELDLVFVSTERLALAARAEMEKPQEEFASGYYVGFGRRYKGVPVVGSKIDLHLTGKGEVDMVVRNWRNIVGEEGRMATVSSRSIEELIVRDPQFRKMYPNEEIGAEDIRVVSVQAGYMEGPVNYRQGSLRPGAVVAFQLKDSRELQSAQLVIPLEEEGTLQSLWGERFRSRR